MGRTLCTLLALLIAALCVSAAAAKDDASTSPADDLTLLKAHNTDADLLALWHLGQPKAAAQLDDCALAELLQALRQDQDWRVRWLAAEALAQARPTYKPPVIGERKAGKNPWWYFSSLGQYLYDDSVFVREAAAREIAAEPPGKQSQIDSTLTHALGDDSPAVRALIMDFLSRSIVANPKLVRSLLGAYGQGQQYQYSDAARYLEGEARNGNPGALAGSQLLKKHDTALQAQQHQIGLAFKQAGPVVMPALLELYQNEDWARKSCFEIWRYLGPQAAGAADVLAAEIAKPEGKYRNQAVWVVDDIAPLRNLKLADALLPLALAQAAPSDGASSSAAVDALKSLGTLPEPYVQAAIAGIQAGTEMRNHYLIVALGSLGAKSDTALAFLEGLARDEKADAGQRAAAIEALAAMALRGNVAAARSALELSRNNKEWRDRILNWLLHKGITQAGSGPGVWEQAPLLKQPEVVALLADELGVVQLALKEPELLQLPEFGGQARAAIVAQLSDPKTAPARIVQLAPLLLRFDPPPAGLGDILAAQYDYARSSQDYAKVLAQLNPTRARERFLQNCDSEDSAERWQAYTLLTGLGQEAAPLLEELAVMLLGAKLPEDQEQRPGQYTLGNTRPPPDPGYLDSEQRPQAAPENILKPYERYQLAQAIGGCGPAAAPYAQYLLWALKQAFREREAAIIPLSALHSQPELLEREIARATRTEDGLIKALAAALAACGPEACGAVLAAAGGALNDAAVASVSPTYPSHIYGNPEHDRRLRIEALRALGDLGAGNETAARLLAERMLKEPTWDFWSTPADDELNKLRKAACAQALGKIGIASDEVVAALLKAAQAEDPSVQAACVTALRKLAGWEYPAAK